MSIQTTEKQRKIARDRTNNNIKKLFEKLRRDSNTSFESDNTVVVIPYNDKDKTPRERLKRKMEPDELRETKQRRISNSSCIVIDDGDLVTQEMCNASAPLKAFKALSKEQCSTPIKTDTKACNMNNDLIILSDTPSGTKLNNNSMTAQNFNKEVDNLTKEINADSYITIDLTNETANTSINRTPNTVIDLASQTDNDDCTLVSVSDTNLSLSGESDVTVLNMSHKKQKQIRKFAHGIAKLDASEKDKLLELITQNIFSGCNVPKIKHNKPETAAAIGKRKVFKQTFHLYIKNSVCTNAGILDLTYFKIIYLQNTDRQETAQDSYIKEVILGQTKSRNSIGSNIYNPGRDAKMKTGLRMIVIDGSNVAME